MALLEREKFLADMSALLGQAAAGGGRLLFLGGEAGVGKSELLRTFCRGPAVREAGAGVLVGACDSLSTPRPLGPLHDMAADGDIGLGRADISGLGRNEVFGSFLERLSTSPTPLVVVFEDVHWADEATLDLLRFLGRRLDPARALMVASYRDDEVGPTHPLRVLMGDLATSPSYRRMQLTRLSLDAVRQLTADSEVDPEELYRRTGGNPFFVTEVLASGESGVPTRISDAVLARAARLPPESRAVLDVCAILGFRFDPRLVAAVADPGADAAPALDDGVAAGVLVANERAMAFRHELARDALLAVVGFTRRRALHQRVLEVLEGWGSPDLSSLAHHAEGALDRDAVLAHAPAAGRAAAAANAHREAAAQFARALRFAEGLPPTERAELLEAYALESVWIDRTAEADEAYRQAIALRQETGDDRVRVMDLVRLANNLMRQGRNRESDETSNQALKLLDTLPVGPEHAFVRASRVYFLMLDRENAAAIVEGERAVALAREFSDENSLILTYNAVGSSRILLGEFERGEKDLLYSLRLARRFGHDNHVAGAYGNLGSGLGEMYRFEQAEVYLREGSDFCRQRDLDFSGGYIDSWLALTRMHRGAWDEAGDLAGDLLRRPGGAAITRIMALVALGRVRARRGDPDAWTVLDEALVLAAQTGTLQRIGPVRAARAEAAFLAGDPQRAASEARSAYDLAIHHRHPWHCGELAYWQRLAGAESAGAERAGALPTMAEPYAHALAGDWAAEAAAWEALGCPYETARALSAASQQEPLERARAIFERLGAAPALGLVEARMRALGHRVPRGPAPSTAANPARLTRREVQILQLLAQGRTNKEIAETLFRSVRTVDHHVSAILGKLETVNRVEAAQRAVQLGLLE